MKQSHKAVNAGQGNGSAPQDVQQKGMVEKILQSLALSRRAWGFLLLIVTLSLIFIRVPRGTVDERHDQGSIMAYEFFAEKKSQFGTEVFQNVGPYGHFQFPQFYAGILPSQKLSFSIVFGILIAGLTVYSFRYFESSRLRWGWVFCLAYAPVAASSDPCSDAFEFLSYLFVLLAGHFLLSREYYKPHALADALILWFLALLTMMKGTNFPLIVLLLSLCGAQNAIQGRSRIVVRDLAVFGVAFVSLWTLAGQRLANIGAYVRGVFAFSGGYNEAMAMNVKNEPLLVLLALSVILLFFALNSLRLWHPGRLIFRIPILVFECACLFIIWKHSFVRADHGVFFRHFITTAIPLLFLSHSWIESFPPSQSAVAAKSYRKVAGQAFGALSLILTVYSAAVAEEVSDSPLERIKENLTTLINWESTRKAWEKEIVEVEKRTDLPAVKREVWNETIDQFGFEPGWILLNKLNYHPRPMSISFAAYNDLLMSSNGRFYRDSATAPVYVLARLGSADNRFVAQDDSLAVVELLRRYQPVLVEKGQVLLKRKTYQPPDYQLKLLETWRGKLGEDVNVPSEMEHPVWCKISVQRSFWGRLVAFLYKPAPLSIKVHSNKGDMGSAKFLTCSGPTGFQINPLIYHTGAFLNAYLPVSQKQEPKVDKLRFDCATKDLAQFKADVEVSFWTMQ
jgi:hypothetical protein